MNEKARILGIRHHGPGSARSVLEALNAQPPELLLIEGPAELEPLAPFLCSDETRFPVAALLYNPDAPRDAIYYPYAEFSPELQATRWAALNRVPVRHIDLPVRNRLAIRERARESSDELLRLANAAGYEEFEDWWEHLVELRQGSQPLFEGIEELIAELRTAEVDTGAEEPADDEDPRPSFSSSEIQAHRESHMRAAVAHALRETERVTVICGAWHAPALRQKVPALKQSLPKVKVEGTIVPWTFERMTVASGYGAGARSPAFYELLWKTPYADVSRTWLVLVARLMRSKDLEASSASVIEAIRLGEALAALRGRSRPGLRELCQAANSVLVRDEAVWRLIERDLIVGDRMGEAPSGVSVVPLLADVRALQKRLRLPATDVDKNLELDLRNDTDIQRSRLLHRVGLLEIDWAEPQSVQGKKGTFHEHWRCRWTPRCNLDAVVAGVWGTTVAAAATAKASHAMQVSRNLGELSSLLEKVLLADLDEVIEPAIHRLTELAATSADVAELADALPPLTATLRYGSVRRTEAERLEPVVDGILVRVCVGFPPACVGVDDETAELMALRLAKTANVVSLLQKERQEADWARTLREIGDGNGVHRMLAGRAARLRFDMGELSHVELATQLRRDCSSGSSAIEIAGFVEGLLSGSGALLVHQDALWVVVDEWVTALSEESFDEILPLVRRTFSLFTKPERRQLGEKASAGRTAVAAPLLEVDMERAMRVLPVIRKILGIEA